MDQTADSFGQKKILNNFEAYFWFIFWCQKLKYGALSAGTSAPAFAQLIWYGYAVSVRLSMYQRHK